VKKMQKERNSISQESLKSGISPIVMLRMNGLEVPPPHILIEFPKGLEVRGDHREFIIKVLNQRVLYQTSINQIQATKLISEIYKSETFSN
jgi:hypothetical protein